MILDNQMSPLSSWPEPPDISTFGAFVFIQQSIIFLEKEKKKFILHKSTSDQEVEPVK